MYVHYIKKFLEKKKVTVVILALNDLWPHVENLLVHVIQNWQF